MSEKMGQSIESNEVKVRLQATPEDVENVKKSIEYSNHLTKANDVLKVLDFPDNIEESYRKILLKQDNKTLEEMAKKSKNEILTFIVNEQNKVTNNIKNQDAKIDIEKNQKETKLNQDIKKIKSVFTPQILEQNSTLSNLFQKLDNNETDKQKTLESILNLLKSDNGKILKSITEQL
ncbi:MAG: hypothetical protein WCR78_09165 [Arcobacteraceae bacterium]|jgi:hypothetical protein